MGSITQKTKQFRHGLIVGKFYPPHEGHLYLISSALPFCDLLTVAVLAPESQTIPIDERVDWLKVHFHDDNISIVGGIDNVRIDYNDSDVWDQHVQHFKNAIDLSLKQRNLKPSEYYVDAVFTSEDYGDELALRMNATHVALDKARNFKTISATMIRDDPVLYWNQMIPEARAFLCKRIVVLGAESTGTTTLAHALCDHYKARDGSYVNTQYVPEYGREYTNAKVAVATALHGYDTTLQALSNLDWTLDDFTIIAYNQMQIEQDLAYKSGPILICDTDAFATSVWFEHYCGQVSAELTLVARRASPKSLYILTDCIGVPFEDDGYRDGEHKREWMTERFEALLLENNLPYIKVSGPNLKSRLAQSITAIDFCINAGWNLPRVFNK